MRRIEIPLEYNEWSKMLSLSAGVPEDLLSEEDAMAQRVDRLMQGVFRGHPDADVLVPLALMEVATDDAHRRALEEAVDDPRRFRDYAYRMVSAVVPPDAPDPESAELEEPDGHGPNSLEPTSPMPPTPSRGMLYDEVSRCISESIALDQSRAGGALFSDDESDEPLQRSDPSVIVSKIPRTEVRKAYLQLAKHYHPDKGGDQEMFVTLQSAYDMLMRADSATSVVGSIATES